MVRMGMIPAMVDFVNLLSTLPRSALFSALFDVEQFSISESTQELGNSLAIREMVFEFLEESRATLDRLESAIDDQDLGAVTRLSQTLRGNFCTFGMMRAHVLACEIEQVAREDRP